MPTKMLKDFLDNHHIKYMAITHAPGYTAQEIAASAHISGKHLAKVVIVKVGDKFAMVVFPAPLLPTTAMVSPAFISNEILSSIF